MNAIAVEKDLK